jgi:hypothetical protein
MIAMIQWNALLPLLQLSAVLLTTHHPSCAAAIITDAARRNKT